MNDNEKVYIGNYLLLGTELELEIKQQLTVFETLITTFIHTEEEQQTQVDLEGNIMPTTGVKKHLIQHFATKWYITKLRLSFEKHTRITTQDYNLS